MFDGSYRTNKREINLAGASASSRSSRTSNLNEARRQRLARAEALAKTNGAICLQRCWRGCYARSELAIDLTMEYEDAIGSINAIIDKKLVDVGPHDHESTKNAVKYYYPSFANQSILIFDDANWTEVVQGAHKGILESGLKILYSKKVLNSLESDTDWWNGLYIVVVEKNKDA